MAVHKEGAVIQTTPKSADENVRAYQFVDSHRPVTIHDLLTHTIWNIR